MAQVLADNPFPKAAPNRTMAVFLDRTPPADTLAGIRGAKDEEIRLGRREIYIHYGEGMGKSKLVSSTAKAGTARNMNTVAVLARMAGARDMRHMARGNADDLGARAFIVIFHGCFLYGDAFGERTSPYCFYSVPASDKTTNPQDWTFAPCLLRTESPT